MCASNFGLTSSQEHCVQYAPRNLRHTLRAAEYAYSDVIIILISTKQLQIQNADNTVAIENLTNFAAERTEKNTRNDVT